MLIQVKKGKVLLPSNRKDELRLCCIFQIVALTFLALIPCKLKTGEYGKVNKVPAFINPVDGKLAGWMKADKITKA